VIGRENEREGKQRYPRKGHLEILPQQANPWINRHALLFFSALLFSSLYMSKK